MKYFVSTCNQIVVRLKMSSSDCDGPVSPKETLMSRWYAFFKSPSSGGVRISSMQC